VEQQTFVAVAKTYVRLHLPGSADRTTADAPPPEVLRLAICDYYKHQDPLVDVDTGNVLHTKHYTRVVAGVQTVDTNKTYVDHAYATLLEEVDTKLVTFTRRHPTDAACTLMYFAPNPATSGHV